MQGKAKQDDTRQDKARYDKATQDKSKKVKGRQGNRRQRWIQEEEEIAGILFRWLLVGQFFPALCNVNFATSSVPVVPEMETPYPLATSSSKIVQRE